MMKLSIVHAGLFKLDGGAMFGVVPKKMWTSLQSPDEQNMCTWAMRCLLVETENRKILIDTGLGDKQDEKFRRHFEPHGPYSLLNSLANLGFNSDMITDTFLTHLHFDHVGGAVAFDEKKKLIPTFPKARYWSNKKHYDWAFEPNARERASFLKENFVPLREAGCLEFIEVAEEQEWLPNIYVHFVYGHTEAMMLPRIVIQGKSILYAADLLPSSAHIGLPYIMAYDVRPLDTLAEKTRLLTRAVEENWILFFEHDPLIECATVKRNERGRIVLDKTMTLQEALMQ